jgi:hypothetical protein
MGYVNGTPVQASPPFSTLDSCSSVESSRRVLTERRERSSIDMTIALTRTRDAGTPDRSGKGESGVLTSIHGSHVRGAVTREQR